MYVQDMIESISTEGVLVRGKSISNCDQGKWAP